MKRPRPIALLVLAAWLFTSGTSRARELWVVTDGSRQVVSIDTTTEQMVGTPIALGPVPTAAPFDIVFARLGPPNVGTYAFVTQGRFLRVIDASTRTITDTIDIGLLLPPSLTLLTMRGASAAAARDYLDGQGMPVRKNHLFVAADVLTASGSRPYFLVLDQAALAGVAPPNVPELVAYGELLPVPGQAMQATVLGMPEGAGFERVWFTVQEPTVQPRFHSILVDTPRALPADDWTIRLDRAVGLPAGTTIPLGINVAAPYGTPLPVVYEPATATDAPFPGQLVNLAVPAACPTMPDGVAIAVTGITPGKGVIATVGSPVTGAPGELRITSSKDCSTTVMPVGVEPTDVAILDELSFQKAFVTNHAANTVSFLRADGSGGVIPVAGSPVRAEMRPIGPVTCAPPSSVRTKIKDADGDGPDDVEVSWFLGTCSPLTVFTVYCLCTVGPCPGDCPFSLHEGPEGGDGIDPGDTGASDWNDIGTTTGSSFTHVNGASTTGALSYDVEPRP